MNKAKSIFQLGEEFTTEKSHDVFVPVQYIYRNFIWNGAVPKYLERQGINYSAHQLRTKHLEFHKLLHPKNKLKWIEQSKNRWPLKDKTYKVLAALYPGAWSCRVHGPVPKVNPQAAARIAALKKKGYIIASRRLLCAKCKQKTMHDILIMLPFAEFSREHNLRAPLSTKLKERIKSILDHKEICFDIKRSSKELIIDHKFPSQRWRKPESQNPNQMSESDIRAKFQLLSNQTNMLKSRNCDNCVRTGMRGTFMGLQWYYKGDQRWRGKNKYDENGCVGCPWYDLEKWKNLLVKSKKLKKKGA